MKYNRQKKFKVNTCREAILKTLLYRSIFKYPLTFYQLASYLITPQKIEQEELRKELNKLISLKKVKIKHKKYELAGAKYLNWQNRFEDSRKLISKNQKVFKILEKIPWIKMIAVTGSAAAYNSERSADLDVLIVSAQNRLWLTRGFVVTILTLLNKQPRVDGEPEKLCTNIFIEENHLEWDTSKQNLYTATDMVLMQPIMQRDNTYFRFIKENKWIFKYYANFHVDISKVQSLNKHSSVLVNKLENSAMKTQLWYMQGKKTTEVTTKHLIHFNKNDNTSRITNSYKELLKERKMY